MLAGDSLRSAADTGVSLVAVSLVHRRGYFEQHLGPADRVGRGVVAGDDAAVGQPDDFNHHAGP